MSYAINWNTAEQRIKTHKDFLLDTAQKMDEERLKFLLEAYEENKGESSFVLRAKLLEKVLLNKSIFLDENLIVGTISGSRAAVYPYPEWQVNWIKDELDAVKMSSLGEVKISDETKDILKQALLDFDGTLIVVSHDRDFLDGLVTKVYEFGNKQVKEHLSGIYEFLEKKKMESLRELER